VDKDGSVFIGDSESTPRARLAEVRWLRIPMMIRPKPNAFSTVPRHRFFPSALLVFMAATTQLLAQSPTPPPRTLFINGDQFTLHPGGQERLPVLSNDYSKKGKIDPQTLVIETPPSQGQAIVVDGGVIEDTRIPVLALKTTPLVYRVATQEGESATAKVSLTLCNQLRMTNAHAQCASGSALHRLRMDGCAAWFAI